MAGSDRRTALRWMGSAAACSFACAQSLAAAPRAGMIAPTGDFLLQRELERGLARGAVLTVTRSWLCHFEPLSRGARVVGHQVGCSVDAPAVLKPLADLERARVAAGPFPALLDSRGRIVDAALESASGKAEAVRIALDMLEQAGLEQPQIAEARAYLTSLSKAAGAVISATPIDLFFPTAGEASESREIPIGQGLTGFITVDLSASTTSSGLLERLERRITARVDGDRRISRETWSLASA